MTKEETIFSLLAKLNEWEQKYGVANRDDYRLKDKGESNARIQDLKARLTTLGARFHWEGKEYVLDSEDL